MPGDPHELDFGVVLAARRLKSGAVGAGQVLVVERRLIRNAVVVLDLPIEGRSGRAVLAYEMTGDVVALGLAGQQLDRSLVRGAVHVPWHCEARGALKPPFHSPDTGSDGLTLLFSRDHGLSRLWVWIS